MHESAAARKLIAPPGCRLVSLPPSSPDLHPIEQAFATSRPALRRIGARSWERVAAAIGQAFATVATTDVRAFFADAVFACRDAN